MFPKDRPQPPGFRLLGAVQRASFGRLQRFSQVTVPLQSHKRVDDLEPDSQQIIEHVPLHTVQRLSLPGRLDHKLHQFRRPVLNLQRLDLKIVV